MLLQFEKDFREVRDLSFCYLCGNQILPNELRNHDHVPPKNAFNARDRSPPLKLKTHKSCHESYSADDNKMGLLMALRRRENPKSIKNTALKIVRYPLNNMAAVENFNIEAAVWRWIKAFHSALYKEPLILTNAKAIQLPFPRADKNSNGHMEIEKIQPQNIIFVEAIKKNRAFSNLDRIVSNNKKLFYECVWCQFDNGNWFCTFAIDIYNWKDLGSHTEEIPSRGCVGFYAKENKLPPENATLDKKSDLIIPNYDILDPFRA